MQIPSSKMSTRRPVFVIVTADTCGHCTTFKNKTLPSLKSRILSEGKCSLVEINFPNTNTIPGPEYHPHLKKYIGWFPTFFLFTGSSWSDHSKPLNGIILNGKLEGDEPKFVSSVNLSDDSIISWINRSISSNPLFTNDESQSLSTPTNSPPDIRLNIKSSNNNLQRVPTIGKNIKFKARSF